MIDIEKIIKGCDSYPHEPWALLLKSLVAATPSPPRRAYSVPAASFLGTLLVQDKTTADSGIEKWGFSELLNRLTALPEEEVLRVEEFDLKEFTARCVLHSNSSTLLGCTIVKRKQNLMRTPPTWDGSIDALKRFNNLPGE